MLIQARCGVLSTGMRILATIRFNRSFDQPVSPGQSDGGDAKADQQLGFVFRSFR